MAEAWGAGRRLSNKREVPRLRKLALVEVVVGVVMVQGAEALSHHMMDRQEAASPHNQNALKVNSSLLQ